MDDVYAVTINIYRHGKRVDKSLAALSLIPRAGDRLLIAPRKEGDEEISAKVDEVWHVISKERNTEEIILDCDAVD